jgi:hypothetical protein
MAIARPIPRDAPVTMATRFLRDGLAVSVMASSSRQR